MRKNQLNPKIISYLVDKTGLSENTIRKDISLLKRKYASCTLNAVAQLYASSHNLSVMQKLKPEDKLTLPHNEVVNPVVKIVKKKTSKREKDIEIIKYDTTDYFIRGHIKEINRAYTKGCYTSTHILARKIIENLVLDILVTKYPPTKLENLNLYFDVSQNRTKDFSILLKSLYDKRKEFGFEISKAIERFYQKAKKFKDDANDKTHSWYHLVENKTEIDELNLQSMIELIKIIKA